MATYTDVFGNVTVPPSQYGYVAVTLSANTTFYWPYNATGDNLTAKLMDVSASSASLTMTLPSATEVSTGEDILIRNSGSNSFSVVSNSSVAVATIAPGEAVYIYLTDNSTAGGVWGAIDYGVGASSVDAASLVGYGIIAAGATLNQSHPMLTTATGITVGATHRATVINFTGGADTLTLTSAVALGDNFFCFVRNSGTGSLTIDPSGVETIDGQGSLDVQPGESLILCCSGAAWFTVGYGRSITYNFTQLVLDVSAAGTFTLTSTQAANKLLTFIGSPASGVTVVVPSIVSVYYVLNSISTAQTVTVKTAAGSGASLSQGVRAILICDSTAVYSAQSATVSTSVQLIDGSVALPSLSFSSSTNTGLYKYSASGLGVAVGGVDAYHYDSGTLTVVGTLTATTFSATTITDTGNLTFSGTGNRITGDFSNATIANRVMFQTSTVNGITSLTTIPNGTATQSAVVVANAADPTNASILSVTATATESSLRAGIFGTGAYLPMTFYTGGSERMRIDTSGNVGVGATPAASTKLRIQGIDSTNNNAAIWAQNSSGSNIFAVYNDGTTVVTTGTGGLGYSTGSGGTVTQATSKSNGVTLNKPAGRIVMATGDAIAGGGIKGFAFTNSMIAQNDIVVLSIVGPYTGQYSAWIYYTTTGQCYIAVKNNTAVSFDEAVVISFAVIKGAIS